MAGRYPSRVLLLLVLGLGACTRVEPSLTVLEDVVLGESPGLRAAGLEPATEYVLRTSLVDALGREWESGLSLRANALGVIDLSGDATLVTSAAEADPFAPLASMTMPSAMPDGWVPPPPRDFNAITWRLERAGSEIARAHTRQWIIPPGVRSERIGGDLVAELFRRDDVSHAAGVLLLGGSGGGMDWARRTAALLANEGLVAMAAAYFNSTGLPTDLIEIPVEYVELTLDSLKNRPEVGEQRIALVGYSKGAELALLVASRRPDVRAVAAFAPGSAVFQGFRAPDYPVVSSWSAGGIGLPFVPNAYDDRFFETYDGMYLWYRTLAQHDAFTAAAIPVERINGDLLLISGVDDQIWPATFMAEQIVARLRTSDSPYSVRHLAFTDAGHGIAAPPGEPLTAVAANLGGTIPGNARARRAAWRELLQFLGRL